MLNVNFDSAQPRLLHDRLTALAAGTEWDPDTADLVYVDKASGRVWALPAPFSPEWPTTGTGAYARYRKAHITTADASKWIEHDASSTGIGDWFLWSNVGPLADYVFFPMQAENAAIYVAFFPYGKGANAPNYLECGWGTVPNDSLTSLRIFGNGKVQVYRDGTKIEEGTCSGRKEVAAKLANQYVGFLLIPNSGRELTILSTAGGSFSTVMPDIEEGEEGTITPAAPFWVQIDEPMQPMFQVAPVVFAEGGSIATLVLSFRQPPAALQVAAGADVRTFGGGSGSLVSADNPGAPYDPNTDPTQGRDCRIKVELSGQEPAYGAMASYAPIQDLTVASEFDAIDYVTSLSFDIGDDGCRGTNFTVEVKSPEALEAEYPHFLRMDGRPVQIGELVNGVGRAPSWSEASGPTGGNDQNRRLKMEIDDIGRMAEEYLFSDEVPLDGLDLVDAFGLLADTFGASLEMDDPEFTIGLAGTPGSRGEWSTLIQVGDTADQWLRRLYETYLGNWFMALCPDGAGGTVLRIKDPAVMSVSPSWTLYPSIQDAVAIGGHSFLDAWKYVYRSLHSTRLAAEANEVVVVGHDPRLNRPIVVSKRSDLLQDPTIPPDERLVDWSGFPRKYGWRDENGIRTVDVAVRCAELLFDRLSQGWDLREFECEMLFHPDGRPGWKGDVVHLYGVGDVRIKTLSGKIVKEPSSGDPLQWREARYVAEENLRPALLRTSFGSLKKIESAYKRRITSRAKKFNREYGGLAATANVLA